MNNQIEKIGLDSGMLNYVDHETPPHYFLSGSADEECLEEFANLIIQDCITQITMIGISNCDDPDVVWTVDKAIQNIRDHFGVKKWINNSKNLP